MIIKSIDIRNFRNYSHLNLKLDKNINIIYGNNGQGKTNILESIYVLAFTKSHRSYIDNNLIKNNEPSAVLKGTILNEFSYNLEIVLNRTNKKVKVDNKNVEKLSSYINKMNVIIFSSEDLDLIKGNPSLRRKYINLELSQLSINYYNALNDFTKLLKIRNEYLKKIFDKEVVDLNYFAILTDYFVNKSVFIYQMRNKFVQKLNNICPEIYESISKLKGFNIKYKPSIKLEKFDKDYIKEKLTNALSENFEKEVKLKTTIYGPHRDDFEFCLEDNNLKDFGSQGQQKMAVLTLKLSEIEIFKDYKKTSPIILLDDVFSDLDNNKKNNLLKHIDNNMQIIITTTDLDSVDPRILEKAKLIKINNGQIVEEEV